MRGDISLARGEMQSDVWDDCAGAVGGQIAGSGTDGRLMCAEVVISQVGHRSARHNVFLSIVDSAHLELVVVGGLLIGCRIRSSQDESRRLRLRHDVRARCTIHLHIPLELHLMFETSLTRD